MSLINETGEMKYESKPVFPEIQRLLGENSRYVKLLEERRQLGIVKYGVELHTFNNRDSVKDFKEEILDAIQYLIQFMMQLEEIIGERQPDKVKLEALELLLRVMCIPYEFMAEAYKSEE